MGDSSERQPNLSLKTIPLFKGPVPKHLVFYKYMGLGEMYDAAGYAWLIRGAKKNILIEAGFDVTRAPSIGLHGEVLGTLEAGLQEEGLNPEDIDIVIATHLHSTHIEGASLLPRARIIVQERELRSALNPLPFQYSDYPPSIVKPLYEANRFDVVDGDVELEPGIKLLLTPGHSAGGQSVQVQAGDKKVVVTGFCSALENFYPLDGKSDIIVPSLFVDIVSLYESIKKVKEIADIIVPLHETKFIGMKTIP